MGGLPTFGRLALAALLTIAAGCESVSPTVSVDVSPASAVLAPGETQAIVATVTGTSNTAVTWSTSCGEVDGLGAGALFTAPQSAGTCLVTARSAAAPAVAASAAMLVVSSDVVVTLLPSAVTLGSGGTQEFVATVSGTTDTAVAWSVSCGSLAGTLTTVLFTAPDVDATCDVTAQSVADPAASASALVTVVTTVQEGCFIDPAGPLERSATVPPTTVAAGSRLAYVPGELLVTFRESPSGSGAEGAAARFRRSAEVAAAAGAVVRFAGRGEAHDLFVVPGDLAAAAARLRADPRVEHVSRNYLATRMAPTDQHYGAQWYLWGFGVEQAWQVEDAGGGGGDIVIAILDDGLNLAHVNLAAKALQGRDVFCGDDDVRSLSDHGTHVASIAAAGSAPSGVVTGVAIGGRAKLLPVKVFPDDDGGGTLDSVLRGMRWAAQLDTGDGAAASAVQADVINMSLGFEALSSAAIAILQSTADAVAAEGIAMFAASGNSGDDTGVLYPARLEHVVAVGAVDWDFTRSSFTTHGTGLDLMAPGGTAPASATGDGVCLRSGRHFMAGAGAGDERGVACLRGTSMASPFVAGAAALLIAHDDAAYRANPAAVAQRLAATALQPSGYTSAGYGSGIVCIDAALGLAAACTVPLP